MKKLIYTLLFSLISFVSFAQNGLITGRVVVDDVIEGQDVVPGISVENERTHAKTLTDKNGLFSTNVSVGDLLNFSNDFYEERSVKVTQEMLKKGFIVVHLNIEVVQLGEANINQLDKNWINNIKNQKSKETILYENLGLDPTIKDKKVDLNASSVLNGNGVLDPSQWVSMISGRKKKAKQQDQYFKEVNKINDLQNYYTTEFFTQNLNIPDYKVNEFVTYCYANFGLEQLVKQNNYERIQEIFEDQAPKYLKKINQK